MLIKVYKTVYRLRGRLKLLKAKERRLHDTLYSF